MFLFLDIFVTYYKVIFNFSVPCIPTFFRIVHFSGRSLNWGLLSFHWRRMVPWSTKLRTWH